MVLRMSGTADPRCAYIPVGTRRPGWALNENAKIRGATGAWVCSLAIVRKLS
jgi:hypothetical protein